MNDGTVNSEFKERWPAEYVWWRRGAFLFLLLMLIGEAALLWWAW